MKTKLSRRITVGLGAAAAVSSIAPVRAANPEKIGIIGTGAVGSALGKRWAALGHTVVFGSREPQAEKVQALVKETGHGARAVSQAEAAKASDILVLALPTRLVVDITKSLGDTSGKVLIDPTNVLNFKDGKVLDPDDPKSIAEQIQAAAPKANLVKAFNTVTARVMLDPKMTGGPSTIPLAGASRQSKERVTPLCTSIGFEVVDLGGNDMLRMVEHLGRIYVGFGMQNRPKRVEFHIRTWG